MLNANGNYRLLTRSDFDGLVCAILLKEVGLLGDIKFVHPKEVQDGNIEVTDRDILTNLPYAPGCHLCFDHHSSEVIRAGGNLAKNHILDPKAESAARVVFNYFGGAIRFSPFGPDMMEAVDKADSARFTMDEVLNPRDWVLMSFLMDARTGLGRYKNFRISNYQLMMDLITYCRWHPISEVLALPDVQERIELYRSHTEMQKEQLQRLGRVIDNAVLIDLRNEDSIYVGNRFIVYALYPKCNISIHVHWGLKQQNTVFAIGKSIFNRTSNTDIGALCLEYGGGGHQAAGTCQTPNEHAERVLHELVAKIRQDG